VAPDGLHVFAGGMARSPLAAVDPVTGALSGDVNLAFTGPRNGTVNIDKLDISPDGSRMVATAQGLWIGSDTDRIGRYEYHGRIAFMPLAGGTTVPESRVGTLPGDLFRLGTDGVDWSTVRGAFLVSGASTPATPTAP
jgi:hypothetical protein